MRAMVLHEWGGPLTLESVPDPSPAHGEVVLRVHACAPDQFDVTIRAGRTGGKIPLVLGHEIAGEVAALGEGVDDFREGDRVIVHAYLTCGYCRFCLMGRETLCRNFGGYFGVHVDGGYAEYVRVPLRNLCRIPDGLSYQEATVAVSPVATPLKAIKTRAGVRPGEHVVIVGACGGVGIHAVQIAKAFGAHVIAVDIDDGKLEKARELGADHIVNGRSEDFAVRVEEITSGKGAETVLEFVGTEDTLPKSFASLTTAGTLVIVGFQPGTAFSVDPTRYVSDEVVVTGSRYVNRAELAEAMDWVVAGKVKPVISGTYPLEEAERALEDLTANRTWGRAPILPLS